MCHLCGLRSVWSTPGGHMPVSLRMRLGSMKLREYKDI